MLLIYRIYLIKDLSVNNDFTIHPLIRFFSSILLIDLPAVIALFWLPKIVQVRRRGA